MNPYVHRFKCARIQISSLKTVENGLEKVDKRFKKDLKTSGFLFKKDLNLNWLR